MFQPDQWQIIAENQKIAAASLRAAASALSCTNLPARQQLILQSTAADQIAQTIESHFLFTSPQKHFLSQ